MKLSEIQVQHVLAGKNWAQERGSPPEDPILREAGKFGPKDTGLFAAVVRLADGSEHPAIVVKSFAEGGDETGIYIHTRFGWMTLEAPGFMRALGKYRHEIFPFDYYIATPWKAGAAPEPDKDSYHSRMFAEVAERLKTPAPAKG